MLKKSSDARNYLKQVISKDFALEFADSFEKAWLLLADYYISVNKFDLAEKFQKARQVDFVAVESESQSFSASTLM